jgi:pyruvate dehydrogenase E1 component
MTSVLPHTVSDPAARHQAARLRYLRALEDKVLWLAVWMIHYANHERAKRDGLKVGGHQASCASVTTLMTALFFDVARPTDRIAVKPHASPVFHAIQYLFGRQTRAQLERFRALHGAQAYPSRTKDVDDVDFSTGSVGLGAAATLFAALVRDYLRGRNMADSEVANARMIAVVGDAELDEGNVFEALLESWKQRIANVWWVVDYNRQSLDTIVPDRLSTRLDTVFRDLGWRVVTIKYGRGLEHAFSQRGGDALQAWIDRCPNWTYSALTQRGGAEWRRALARDLAGVSGIGELLDSYDDGQLHALMTNLGGHDLEALLDAFHAIEDDRPTCFLAYTVKGYRLPLAGHKDNHAGLLTSTQIEQLRSEFRIEPGDEWQPFAGTGIDPAVLREFVDSCPWAGPAQRRHDAATVRIPKSLRVPARERQSTQEGFGRLLAAIARDADAVDLADRIVTTSPDVTVSTNLGSWVNRRGVYDRDEHGDPFEAEQLQSAQRWHMSPGGQHIELGIAENNLFLLLAAAGLCAPLFGVRLLPIGTVYDPFINRGLDALNYACYQNARFILVGTPSGLTLAPEGGAHQSVYTPLIGIGQPGLTMFEPAYVDELAEQLRWSFEHLQQPDGASVYFRLSTKPLEQPKREWTAELAESVVAGGYWLVPPQRGAELAIVCSGAAVSEAVAAHHQLVEDVPSAGILVITSSDRLHRDWLDALRTCGTDMRPAYIERLLEPLSERAGLVTVIDGHPATLSWLGGVCGHRVSSLGVSAFGQSGDVHDLYALYEIDADAIVTAAARLYTARRDGRPAIG